MSNNDDGSESIRKRLDVIIRLLMEEQVQSGSLKRVEQLKLLHEIGLTSARWAGYLLNLQRIFQAQSER